MSENKKLAIYLLVCLASFLAVLASAGCQLGGPQPTVGDLVRQSMEQWCACEQPESKTCVDDGVTTLCRFQDCAPEAPQHLRAQIEQCLSEREDACPMGEEPCGL